MDINIQIQKINFTVEIVRFNGPDHDPGQLLVPGQVRLHLHRLLIVEADPLVVVDHVGRLVTRLPLHLPALLLLVKLLTDLVVSQEARLSSVRTCNEYLI